MVWIAAIALGASGSARAQDDWVPPGFEALNEPQETLVDVFYAGYFLVSVPARFSPGQITFLQVDPIVESINDLKNPDELRSLMAVTLDTNETLVCKSRNAIDCGRMETSTVGVIFDKSRLTANLFLGPELLRVRTRDQIDFLPNSDGGLSVLDDVAMFVSGSNEGDVSFNLRNTTLVAYRESRLNVLSNYTNIQGLTIDTLALEREKNGLDYSAGYFRANAGGFVFMQNETFLGATFGSSLVTRNDLEFSLGSKLTLFLDSRSLVQIFRDGRLLSSGYYDAGNQEVDTRSLPGGAYEVELVITDIQGRTRSERQFYSKSSRLPPASQSLFFVQAGQYSALSSEQVTPELLGDSFIRAGIESRLTPTIAGRLGMSTNDDSTMLEAGLFHQGTNYELQAAAAYDQFSVSALEVRGRYRYNMGTLTVFGRQIWAGDVPFGDESQIGEEVVQVNVSAGLNTPFGSFNVFANYNESEQAAFSTADAQQDSYGITWRDNSFLGIDGLSPNLEISNNRGEGLVLLNLTYRSRSGAWTNSANAQFRRQTLLDGTNATEVNGNAATSWASDTSLPTTYRADLRVDHQDSTLIESGIEATANEGAGSVFVSHNIDSGLSNYSASMRTSFAATTNSVGMGGKRSANAGFLVSVEGEDNEDVEVDILVDKSKRATVGVNEPVFIPATPYDTYDVEFKTAGNSLAQVSYKPKPLTLYMGNVVAVTASIQEIVVGLGRILTASGAPLANALIKNASGLALTDDNGYFQAEIDKSLDELIFVKGTSECVVALPDQSRSENVSMLGTMTCELR